MSELTNVPTQVLLAELMRREMRKSILEIEWADHDFLKDFIPSEWFKEDGAQTQTHSGPGWSVDVVARCEVRVFNPSYS